MIDRRSLIKLFGVGAAVIPVSDTIAKGTEIEKITTAPRSIAPSFDDPSRWMDVQHGRLYSALLAREGTCNVPFFDYACGMPPCGHFSVTTHETNLWNACRLDEPEAFLVKRMGLVFSPAVRPVVRSIIANRCTLTLQLGHKIYQRGPVAQMFHTADENFKIENPEHPIQGFLELDLPIIIPSQLNFKCELEGYGFIGSTGTIWCVLEGLHARGVQ